LYFPGAKYESRTDVLARVIANDSNLKVSNMIIVLDSAVVLLGLIVFKDWAVPLYSWFTIFVYGKIVEMFQTENPNRAVFIVSRKTQELKTLIVDKMGSLPEIHQTSSAHKRSILQKTSSIHHSKPILILAYPQIYGIILNSIKYRCS